MRPENVGTGQMAPQASRIRRNLVRRNKNRFSIDTAPHKDYIKANAAMQQLEAIMRKDTKPVSSAHQGRQSTFFSLLTGWFQQGVESFLSTQRILVDAALRQNTAAVKNLRDGISDPDHSPVAILTELAVEGTSTFIEAQRVLLNMAHQENEIIMGGVKERVADSVQAVAMTDLMRRSLDTFITMQRDFLKLTSKETMSWLEQVQAGKGYQTTHVVNFAREGMETFVEAQKKFLDVVAQETAKATSGRSDHTTKGVKKTELSKLAREATDSFVDAQKRLLDVMGQQMNVNLKAATRTMEMVSPSRLLPMANFTGEGVKSFVNAEKALIESMIKPKTGTATVHSTPKHKARLRRTSKAKTVHAAA